ncbi:glycoside hydrolase family 43 protein [Phocaeicola paurosaccharolyticus]|mgnify:CR=1 FL=1|uniref:glycoside hydrolase family 43 protein n=1 Tax=Phocaeicola paurosaccharolyticus TaxID=732242 RepID=UPI002FE2776D
MNNFLSKSILGLALGITATVGVNAAGTIKADKNSAEFSKFIYQGKDRVYQENPLKEGEFYNPILQGCYPDPSICRKGNDYYLVTSTFAMFPGVPIFHSTDLVNWKQIGHVLDRKSQLKVEDCGISAGIYAPTIRYNANNDTFYMITTQFSGGFGNIVVKTKDPMKGWSDPIKLAFNGIDPDIFFDDNGKAYIVHNDAPDRGKELYEGHRVIKIWDYDVEKDSVIQGTSKIIVDGGVDITKKPIWIEAPHMYKKNGKYYLMCAEGGTGDNHSEVVFISDSPKGPFKPWNNNPILSQRHLPIDRPNKIDWAGHADIVEGQDGKYYGVFLGIRPNTANMVNTGRETFILPVDWSGTFPVFENGLIPMECKIKTPAGVVNHQGKDGFFQNGNFTFTENFTSANLDYRWVGLRTDPKDIVTIGKKGGLKMVTYASNIKEVKPISALFYRQQHARFSAQTTVNFKPKSDNDLAGLTCYQSERFNYVFGITKEGKKDILLLARTERGKTTIIAKTEVDAKQPITLYVDGMDNDYKFNYSVGGEVINLGGTVSGDILSTNRAGGFTGAMIGLYTTKGNTIK